MSRPARAEIRIDPSGRPLERAGFEAIVALGFVVLWIVAMGGIFALMGRGAEMAASGPWPTAVLIGLCALCWLGAEGLTRRRHLIWPASALGILGPLSLGFAFALSSPELRTGPFLPRLAIIAETASVAMIPFLFRFRLPGLVSPIITFALVGLFLNLYGADAGRLREVEGFSPRGIIAALMQEPGFMALFGGLALGAVWLARRLDWRGENFSLAAARPLHLIGAGVVALVAGRLLGMLPMPLDLIGLALALVAAQLWSLRVNRIAVAFAAHFAMLKPVVYGIGDIVGARPDLTGWTVIVALVLIVELAIWPRLHRWSRSVDWTRGPGGRRPPLDRPGSRWWWRYWPYALEDPKSEAPGPGPKGTT